MYALYNVYEFSIFALLVTNMPNIFSCRLMYGLDKIIFLGALGCLFGAKLLNVQIPFLFKYAIDSLHLLPPLDSPQHTIITTSAAFVIGYGAARLG